MNKATLEAMKAAMLELETELRRHGASGSMIARASEAITAIEWEMRYRDRKRQR